MKFFIPFSLFAVLSFTAILVGCGPKLPPGMPPLYKASVTIKDGETPVEGVYVTFFNADASIPEWTIGGVTDERGFLQIKTYGQYDGAPKGEYKIVLSKMIREDAPDPPEMGASEQEVARYESLMEKIPPVEKMPKKFTSALTTPLTLKIEKKGENTAFDISR